MGSQNRPETGRDSAALPGAAALAGGAATVIVVDDDPVVRRSVARLVRAVGYDVQTFATPQQFLEHPLPAGPSCVVLDICMDGMTGLEVQERLGCGDRQIPVIFLSGHGTIPTAAHGFKHGAQDFLEKPVRPAELLDAVRRAIDSDRGRAAGRAELHDIRTRFAGLTPREQEVMRLVVSGRLNKQAAAELAISEKTIKVHRARVMEKMRAESLAALVLMAERVHLTPPPAEMVVEAAPTWIY
jgi:FixJ family two-component response regulator